jgi:hypothetical protein
MAKDDYTKEEGGSATKGLRKYRMPIMRDTETAPHYKMRLTDKNTIRSKSREKKRT